MKYRGLHPVPLLLLVLASSLTASAIQIDFDGIITSSVRGTGSGPQYDLMFSVAEGDRFHGTYSNDGSQSRLDFFFGNYLFGSSTLQLQTGDRDRPQTTINARISDDSINLTSSGESSMSYVWVDFTMGGPLQGDATGDLKVWFWDYDYIFRGTVEHIGAVSVSDSDSTALLLAIPLALILIFRSLKRHTPANTHPAERNLAIRRASAAVPAAA